MLHHHRFTPCHPRRLFALALAGVGCRPWRALASSWARRPPSTPRSPSATPARCANALAGLPGRPEQRRRHPQLQAPRWPHQQPPQRARRGQGQHDNPAACCGERLHDNGLSAATTTIRRAPSTRSAGQRVQDDTRRLSGQNSRLLEASYAWQLAARRDAPNVKLGATRWWGESLFWPNISQGQVPVDATKFNVPGTEAKESHLPGGSCRPAWALTDSPTVTGYYQYKWGEIPPQPGGRLFGSDYFGPGAQFYRLAPGAIGSLPDRSLPSPTTPARSGAGLRPVGSGARHQLSDNTELGLFHHRYHDWVGRCSTTSPAPPATVAALLRGAGPRRAVRRISLAYFEDIAHRRQRQHQVRRRGAGGRRPDTGTARRCIWTTARRPAAATSRATPTSGTSSARAPWLPPDHAAGRGGSTSASPASTPLTVSGGVQNGSFSRHVYDGQTRSSSLAGVGVMPDTPPCSAAGT